MNNYRDTQMFLQRMNWMVNTGEWTEIREFQIDVYRFRFKKTLKENVMTEFTEFLLDLNLVKLQSVMLIWVWLYQHGTKPKMSFAWNRRRSLWSNLKFILKPRMLHWILLHHGYDDLMECPVEELKQKLKLVVEQ